MTASAPRIEALVTGDGHRYELIARIPEAADRALLWLPAMGVPAKHYLPFAEQLAARGIAVFLHEWRGNGSSSLRPSRTVDWGYREILQLDLPGLLHHDGGAPIAVLLQVVLVFVLVEVFDATGTLYGVASRAGLLKLPSGQKRFGRALLADSTAIVAGSLLGTSSTTAFAESASGVEAGGRTGLTALVIAALFLAALLFSPLAAMVPPQTRCIHSWYSCARTHKSRTKTLRRGKRI